MDKSQGCCPVSEREQSEVITCPQCGNKVKDAAILRCPRCNKPLLQGVPCTGACKKCTSKQQGPSCR